MNIKCLFIHHLKTTLKVNINLILGCKLFILYTQKKFEN